MIKEKLLEIINNIVNKCLSARFLMTIIFSFTYCGVILGCTYAMLKGKLTIDAFLGIFVGFVTLSTMITKSYFDKYRPKENGGGQ